MLPSPCLRPNLRKLGLSGLDPNAYVLGVAGGGGGGRSVDDSFHASSQIIGRSDLFDPGSRPGSQIGTLLDNVLQAHVRLVGGVVPGKG